MRRVLELIRVSTESQAADSRASIPAQREVNRRTAQAYGLQIVKTIEIIDVSGAAVLLSPGMQELIKLIDDPEIGGVVTREFSRLMRPENFADYALLQAFADSNTELFLPDGPLNFGSKNGRLMGAIRAAMAGVERSEILERIWSAKESKRRAGGFAQSWKCLPYGVTFNEKWSYTPEAENVREAFRLLLTGELTYSDIGRQVGIDQYSLRVILRNPIYTGVRVVDKRRDTSARARKTREGGKQGDRPKILRAPEEVIRVRVIDDGLITESDFQKAQQLMDAKKKNHWRGQGKARRFTYNGFLICGACERLVYTAYQRDDYYVCKGRRHGGCETGYMRRDILDPLIDSLLATELTDIDFLNQIESRWQAQANRNDDASRLQRLEAQLGGLQAKRGRILDAYVDGALERGERDRRLAEISTEMTRISDLILRSETRPVMTARDLADIFQVFEGYQFLEREHKRRLLSVTVPEIKVANYRIEGLYLFERSSEVSHTDKAYLVTPRYIPLGVQIR